VDYFIGDYKIVVHSAFEAARADAMHEASLRSIALATRGPAMKAADIIVEAAPVLDAASFMALGDGGDDEGDDAADEPSKSSNYSYDDDTDNTGGDEDETNNSGNDVANYDGADDAPRRPVPSAGGEVRPQRPPPAAAAAAGSPTRGAPPQSPSMPVRGSMIARGPQVRVPPPPPDAVGVAAARPGMPPPPRAQRSCVCWLVSH
jgi:hypothetical protein